MVEIINFKNRQYYDYWKKLNREQGNLIPNRSSLVPEDIPALLPNMIVYELISREDIRIRLQGTAMNERFGQDMTGGNYLDYVHEERRKVASDAFWLMAQQPCGIIAKLIHALSSGREIIVESIGFPYRNDTIPGVVNTANPIIIYQSNEIEGMDPRGHKKGERLKRILVLDRTIIDIGNGAPTFVD